MKESKSLLLFLSPIILVICIVYSMICWTFYVSVTNWVGMAPPSSLNIIGLENYISLINMERFWNAIKNNLIWLITFAIPATSLGFILALLLDQRIRGESIFRSIFLFPTAISYVITGTLWSWMYDPAVGVINTMLRALKLDFLAGPWVTDPNIALYCLVIAAIWQCSGISMVIYLASLRSIPPSLIESALIDGASFLQIVRYVIIPSPQIIYATVMVLAMQIMFSLKVFDIVWVMTMGGPGYSTDVLANFMFIATFRQDYMGLGAGIAVVIFLLSLAIIIPYSLFVMKKWYGW